MIIKLYKALSTNTLAACFASIAAYGFSETWAVTIEPSKRIAKVFAKVSGSFTPASLANNTINWPHLFFKLFTNTPYGGG